MKITLAAAIFVSLSASAALSEVNLVPGKVAAFDITGEPSGFDPKSKYTFVDRPKREGVVPVLLYIHGGGGYIEHDKKAVAFFKGMGFATVAFDAFKLNKIPLSSNDLSQKLSLNAKQRMLLPVSTEALAWILEQEWADKSAIYIYGQSNGARIALVLAGRVDQNNVRLVMAEAPAQCCIPLPAALRVPTKLFYGNADNWGATEENDLLYTQKSGSLASVKEWAETQNDGNLEVKFYDGGHGLFYGKGVPSVRIGGVVRPKGGDVEKLKRDIKEWVGKK